MKYLKPINEFWGDVLKRDLLGETREEDKFRSKEQLQEYLKSEIEKQGENVVIRNLDVSLVEDLSYLFNNDIANRVKNLDLSGWKTDMLKKMHHMFSWCDNIESLNLSGWDVSNVKNMRELFFSCRNLISLDLSGWDTSNVTDMGWMFASCMSLESLDLSGWNVSNVEKMFRMFQDCRKLKSLDLSGWDTSNVKDMCYMFNNCPAPYEVIDNKIVKK